MSLCKFNFETIEIGESLILAVNPSNYYNEMQNLFEKLHNGTLTLWKRIFYMNLLKNKCVM